MRNYTFQRGYSNTSIYNMDDLELIRIVKSNFYLSVTENYDILIKTLRLFFDFRPKQEEELKLYFHDKRNYPRYVDIS
jgi:hypothetical protein